MYGSVSAHSKDYPMMESSPFSAGRIIVSLLVCAALLTAAESLPADTEIPRQVAAQLFVSHYLFDSDYFGLDSGTGLDLSLRYEITYDVYLESTIGFFTSGDGGVTVTGLQYQIGCKAVLPYFIPYRPIVRGGFAFISVNPVTVTPTETFRPSQTAFYFYGGTGMSRSIVSGLLAELTVNVMATPYRYRVYTFDRMNVEIDNRQFIHLGFQVGLSYTF